MSFNTKKGAHEELATPIFDLGYFLLTKLLTASDYLEVFEEP